MPPKTAINPSTAPGLVTVKKNVCGMSQAKSLKASRGFGLTGHLQPGRTEVEPQTEHNQRYAAAQLNDRAVRLHGARESADAEARTESDQTVAHNRADTCGDAAPEAALDGALNTQHVDRSNGRRNENAGDQSDRNDERVRDIGHQGGMCSVLESDVTRARRQLLHFSTFTRNRETQR